MVLLPFERGDAIGGIGNGRGLAAATGGNPKPGL